MDWWYYHGILKRDLDKFCNLSIILVKNQILDLFHESMIIFGKIHELVLSLDVGEFFLLEGGGSSTFWSLKFW